MQITPYTNKYKKGISIAMLTIASLIVAFSFHTNAFAKTEEQKLKHDDNTQTAAVDPSLSNNNQDNTPTTNSADQTPAQTATTPASTDIQSQPATTTPASTDTQSQPAATTPASTDTQTVTPAQSASTTPGTTQAQSKNNDRSADTQNPELQNALNQTLVPNKPIMTQQSPDIQSQPATTTDATNQNQTSTSTPIVPLIPSTTQPDQTTPTSPTPIITNPQIKNPASNPAVNAIIPIQNPAQNIVNTFFPANYYTPLDTLNPIATYTLSTLALLIGSAGLALLIVPKRNFAKAYGRTVYFPENAVGSGPLSDH